MQAMEYIMPLSLLMAVLGNKDINQGLIIAVLNDSDGSVHAIFSDSSKLYKISSRGLYVHQ